MGGAREEEGRAAHAQTCGWWGSIPPPRTGSGTATAPRAGSAAGREAAARSPCGGNGGRVTGYSGARTCRPEPLRKCERPGTPGSGDRSLQEGHKEQDPHAQLGSQGHRPHPATRAAGGSDADVAPARRGSPAWGPAPPSELLRDRLSAGPPGSRKFRAHLLCSE